MISPVSVIITGPHMNNSLVSVIIPTYNCANYVVGAVKSALNQTYENCEIIVVDDGSSDNTKEVLTVFGNKISYIYQTNKGLSAARNTGIKAARGKYIAFLDSDDIWLKDKLKQQLKKIEGFEDVGIVGCGEYRIDSTGRVSIKSPKNNYHDKTKLFHRLLNDNCITGSGSGVLVRKECFEKVGLFDEELSSAEDWDMWLRIVVYFDVEFTNQPLVLIRVRSDSLCSSINVERMLSNELVVLNKVFLDTASPGKLLKSKALSRRFYSASIGYRELENKTEMRKNILKALKIYPFGFLTKSYLGLLIKSFTGERHSKINSKIRIGFVNYSLNIGGIETLILEICKRLNKETFIPYIFVFEKNGKLKDEYLKAGMRVVEVEKGIGFDWLLSARLSKMLKTEKIDIVHTHNPTNWLYGGIAAWLSGIPLIHTEHTTTDYDNHHVKRWEFIEWFLAKLTRHITAVAGSVREHMMRRSSIPPDKITVIYNAIEMSKFDVIIDREKLRNELSINNADIIIGNIARFYENKDHPTLLHAFKLVAERMPCVHLLLIGDGPLRGDMEHLAEKLGEKSRIRFLGNRRDIPHLLKTMDLFVLSSKREGLPVVLLEAMASGLPVVTTDVDGNGELVLHEQTGLVVPSNDPARLAESIIKVLANKNDAKKMGNNGRERVRNHFTFNTMVNQYEDIYTKLVS